MLVNLCKDNNETLVIQKSTSQMCNWGHFSRFQIYFIFQSFASESAYI